MCLCICIGMSLACFSRQAHPSLPIGREAPPAQPLATLLHTVDAPRSTSLLKCRSLGGTLSASFS